MAELSIDQLRVEYKAALHREMQVRKRNQELEEVLLRAKGKFMQAIQEIDLSLKQLARESERQLIANDIRRLEPPR